MIKMICNQKRPIPKRFPFSGWSAVMSQECCCSSFLYLIAFTLVLRHCVTTDFLRRWRLECSEPHQQPHTAAVLLARAENMRGIRHSTPSPHQRAPPSNTDSRSRDHTSPAHAANTRSVCRTHTVAARLSSLPRPPPRLI